MSLDVLNPVSLKRIKAIGGFTFVDSSYIDNINFWEAGLISDEVIGVGTWIEQPVIPDSRERAKTVTYNSRIYIISGVGGSNTLLEYNPSTDSYTTISLVDTGDGIPSLRSGCAVSMYGSSIYMFGGYAGSTIYDDAWSINVTNGNCYSLASLPSTPPIGATSTHPFELEGDVYGNKIYIFGMGYSGATNTIPSNRIWEYNISTNTWDTSRLSAPTALQNNTVNVIGNYLYSVGGDDGSSSYYDYNYRYDIISDTWDVMEPCSIFVSDHISTVYNGDIYIFGGENIEGDLNTAYIYDVSDDMWSNFPNTPIPTTFSAGDAVTIGSDFYITSNGSLWVFNYNSARVFVVERFY